MHIVCHTNFFTLAWLPAYSSFTRAPLDKTCGKPLALLGTLGLPIQLDQVLGSMLIPQADCRQQT